MTFGWDEFEYRTVDVYSGGPVKAVVRVSAHVHRNKWAVLIFDCHFYVGLLGEDGHYRNLPGLACHSADDVLALVGELHDELPGFRECLDDGRLLLKDKDRNSEWAAEMLIHVKDDDWVCQAILVGYVEQRTGMRLQ